MAIVGLVLVFSEKFELANKTTSLDKGNEITSFSITSLFSKQDCVSSSARPCYDKKTGKKFIPLEPKGAENAFAVCLKNRALNENGELAAKTSKCDAERYQYCYNGKSGNFLRKFEGQCISSQPSPNTNALNCPSLPYLGFVGSVEPVWNNYLYSPHLRSLLQSKSGALYASGQKLISGVPTSWGSDSQIVPIIYKSIDGGITWAGVELPYDTSWGYGDVRYIREASDGSLYAAGTFLWKSTDGGVTWSIISGQFGYTISDIDGVPDVLQSKDGSILALLYPTSEIYKSVDGGDTWQFLSRFQSQYEYLYNFIEADDGSLVFSTYYGGVYRYANGVFTKVLSINPLNDIITIPLLKARDGNIYLIADASTAPVDYYTLDRPLYSFMSSDNGITWTKTGALPYSSFANRMLMEASDGTIWSASFSPCWFMTLYKSTDKTATWSTNATVYTYVTSNWGLGYKRINALAEVNGKIYAAGEDSGGIFSTS